MTRSLSLILLGIIISIPLWFVVERVFLDDVHTQIRDCRATVSAFLEGGE
ncbi:hypothetical protein QEZ48_19585 [Aquamicrobium lusatiense]|nr:hypothetical protein [Aquamicrobium lusatiense]MDH4993020.1 hypothetical protein [Aquamicrobium lusatiense]